MRGALLDGVRVEQAELLEQRGVDRVRPGVEVLRSHVDHELVAVERDLDTADVSADRFARLEERDVVRAVEQPRQGDTRHAPTDDADRASSGSRAGLRHRQHRGGSEQLQEISTAQEPGHGCVIGAHDPVTNGCRRLARFTA